jgi:hypothetical protein
MDEPSPAPTDRSRNAKVGGTVIAVLVVLTALVSIEQDDSSSGSDGAPLTVIPSVTSVPTPTETALVGLTVQETAFLEAMGEEEPFSNEDKETLGDGWQACTGDDEYGYKGGDTFTGPEGPPTAKILRDNLHDSSYEDLYKAAITHLCPKYLPLLKREQERLKGSFEDGVHEVGKDVEPGTYRTDGKTTDCYWERSTSGGNIIDNGFVTNAPKGVTVTIAPSDGGFTSRDCGLWLRVQG